MKAIAIAAGVGIGTVSRVLTNRGSVAEETRHRVEAAAAELNYRPSALGRGLRSQRTTNLGLIVADISNSFYGEFAEGVLAAARSMNRHVIVGSSDESPENEREYIDLLIEQRVDGIIAFPTGGNVGTWNAARDLGITLVFADRTLPELTVPSVVVDNAGDSARLTEYLLALGHRRIGYLGGPIEVSSGRLREEGYREAHAGADLPVDEELVVRGRFTRDTGYAGVLRMLSGPRPPTALIATNNILGEAALAAIRSLSISVPDELSFVMFDDVPWATITRPAITVLSQPARRLGDEAARLVVSHPDPATQIVVTTDLIIRDSAHAWHANT